MSVFAIYNDSDADATLISNRFIDDFMRDANDAQLKIYLYLVRMMGAGRPTSIADMADRFNHTEKEVLRSLRYWEKKGLLKLQCDSNNNPVSIHLCSCDSLIRVEHQDEIRTVPEALPAVHPAAKAAAMPAAAQGAVQSAVQGAVQASDSAVSDREALLYIVEQYIGKPLSADEMRIVYYISDDLHFSFEMIDYLVQYCVEKGKRDLRYIEKTAMNLTESGVHTYPDLLKALGSGRKKSRAKTKSAQGTAFSMQRAYDSSLEQLLLDN